MLTASQMRASLSTLLGLLSTSYWGSTPQPIVWIFYHFCKKTPSPCENFFKNGNVFLRESLVRKSRNHFIGIELSNFSRFLHIGKIKIGFGIFCNRKNISSWTELHSCRNSFNSVGIRNESSLI